MREGIFPSEARRLAVAASVSIPEGPARVLFRKDPLEAMGVLMQLGDAVFDAKKVGDRLKSVAVRANPHK